MPKRVRWGSGAPKAKDIDQWDRSSQYQPYDGPEPPNSLFYFKIKQLKQRPATGGKLPSLQIGLELVPRRDRPDEKKYKGYFIMDFPPISPQTMFRYVPFLDALGVSGADLLERTVVDDDGNILKIGRWINDGSQYVGASLKDDSDASGNYRKGVGTYTAIETKRKKAAASEDEESEEDYQETEEEEYEEDEAEEGEEESEEDSDEGFEEDDLDWDEEE